MRGQALIETLCSATLMCLVGLAGFTVIMHAMGSFILAKWAAEASHCVGRSEALLDCKHKTEKSLAHYFAFRKVNVQIRALHGVVHSEIDANLIGITLLRSSYDLEPSEYKRHP